MIKLEVNEKATTVELKGEIRDTCTELTMALLEVIKKDKRFASAVRIALLLTGETEMPIEETLALLETIIKFKDGEKQ